MKLIQLERIAIRTDLLVFDIVSDACDKRTKETGIDHGVTEIYSDIIRSKFIPHFVAIQARQALVDRNKEPS